MAPIFLWLPRERAAGRAVRTSLILAVVALVLAVVFWTGLCFAVAAGAMALGLFAMAAGAQTGGQGKATAAVILAAGRSPQPICSASSTMIPSGPRT
jgi:hypothetical protein